MNIGVEITELTNTMKNYTNMFFNWSNTQSIVWENKLGSGSVSSVFKWEVDFKNYVKKKRQAALIYSTGTIVYCQHVNEIICHAVQQCDPRPTSARMNWGQEWGLEYSDKLI